MRIISGIHKGRVIKVPNGLNLRPTTDFAKEGLFNILNNLVTYNELKVLDLFCGTGYISFEFASRGCINIYSVDINAKCLNFIRSINDELKLNINTVKKDAFAFLKTSGEKFDLIFADPPYELSNIFEIHQIVFEKKLLNENGFLIIEHGQKTNLSALSNYTQTRKYGNVNFSFFKL
ncbi:MAG: RsmD family RNA methyltransferase [Bacteroidetes bacterium]|nr:RsmD family RNA methyltransferase [Bacteroidota bacterium]